MKKYKFSIQGNQYDVQILNIEDDIAEIEVNGTLYKVEVEKKVHQTKTPKLVRSAVAPSTESHTSTAKTSSPAVAKGAGLIKSPLPGTILNLFIKEGDQVKIGDKLILLEAMKMENNINADKEGVVKSILVKVGDSVLEGTTLIEIGV